MSIFESRATNWKNGPIVYQIFVDRFRRSESREADSSRLKPRQKLKKWSDLPKHSKRHAEGYWPHCYEMWGGDLNGVREALPYLKSLNVDIVYLTPIFQSPTNHKYDTEDYFAIDPWFGTEDDLDHLISEVHKQGMKIMLDGVFNHAGETNSVFLESKEGKNSDWFDFGDQFNGGVRGFFGSPDMPAWRLENEDVQGYLWKNSDSVVKHYLDRGIDGWRLDVGFDIGPKFLKKLTEEAHAHQPESAVIAEILGYPDGWQESVDGTFNFYWLRLMRYCFSGEIAGSLVGSLLQDWVDKAGIEFALRCWLHLDNHDTPRIASLVSKKELPLLFAMLLTLPGSPVLYYGSELGMKGGNDPECRAPMKWSSVDKGTSLLTWVKKLTEIRKNHIALQVGDYNTLRTGKIVAYSRTTDKLFESVVVVVNPTEEEHAEVISTNFGHLMSGANMVDLLDGERYEAWSGIIKVSVPAYGVRVLVPETLVMGGYSPYMRIP